MLHVNKSNLVAMTTLYKYHKTDCTDIEHNFKN